MSEMIEIEHYSVYVCSSCVPCFLGYHCSHRFPSLSPLQPGASPLNMTMSIHGLFYRRSRGRSALNCDNGSPSAHKPDRIRLECACCPLEMYGIPLDMSRQRHLSGNGYRRLQILPLAVGSKRWLLARFSSSSARQVLRRVISPSRCAQALL